MNIKQHIEAGRFPLDLRKRPLLETRDGDLYTIICTDRPGSFPIVGFCAAERDSYQSWTEDGQSEGSINGGAKGFNLLAPAPRKVEVKRWAEVRIRDQAVMCTFSTDGINAASGHVMVELTGSYEMPWGDE